MNQITTQFDNQVNSVLSIIDNNEYVSAALNLFLILYAGLAAPTLPAWAARLFDNALFKLLILFLIAYTARKNPTVALIAAIGVMVSINTLNKLKVDEMIMKAANAIPFIPKMINNQTIPEDIIVEEQNSVAPESIAPDAVADIAAEEESCNITGNYRNSFYPQYVNMSTDAYDARYISNSIDAYDKTAKYASI